MRGSRLATRMRLGTEALEALDGLRRRPIFLVTDDSLATAGVYREVVDRLSERVTTFTDVKSNPSTSKIGARMSVYLQPGPDVIVTYGGGSMMDAAKVMHKAALDAGFGASEGIVTIPTTNGSGSEVTSFAVVTDEQTHTKVPTTSSELVAGLAILDPEAVVGMPSRTTTDSGMSVLAHATEAYVTLETCDSSDALAERAVELVFGNLEHYYTHGDNPEVRSHIRNTPCMAVTAFNGVGLSIVYSLTHALGGHYPIVHGRLNALLLPHVIEFSAARSDRTAKRYARLSKLLHPSARGRAAVMLLIGAIERLRSRLGVPSRLSDLKVASEVLHRDEDDLVAAALAGGYTMATPVTPLPGGLKGVLRRIA